MYEKLKIVSDDKGNVKIWMDGKEVHGIRKIKFECEAQELPNVEIDFYVPLMSVGGRLNEKQK